MSVVVVGGGVLGFMHALEARRRGHQVTHLEREPGSRGASVRNFGLIWVSGRAGGPELDLARRARVRWAEIAAEVPGTGFRPNGRPGRRLTDWPWSGGPPGRDLDGDGTGRCRAVLRAPSEPRSACGPLLGCRPGVPARRPAGLRSRG